MTRFAFNIEFLTSIHDKRCLFLNIIGRPELQDILDEMYFS